MICREEKELLAMLISEWANLVQSVQLMVQSAIEWARIGVDSIV